MSLLVAVSLLATLITTFYLYVTYIFTYWKRKGVPFAKPSIPFGNLATVFQLKRSFGQNLHDLYHSSDVPVLGLYVALRPALLIRDPTIIRDIFIKDFQYFWHRGFHLDSNVDPMAENLFSQSGDKWKEMRSNLSSAFTSGKLKGMIETIIEGGKKLEECFSQYAISGKEVEVREISAQFTTNVIASVGFGLNVDCFENPKHEFRVLGGRFFEPLIRNVLRFHMSYISPYITKLFGVRFVDKDVADFMVETIRQNLEYREKNKIIRKDFFQLMIQLRNTGKLQEDDDDWGTKASNSQKSMSLEDMAAQAHIFFIAGYESTSTTMTFCLHELAKEPSIQQEVYKEIINVLNRHDGKLNYESLSEMKLLDCCIDETLRMHPPFDLISRQCTKDYKIADTEIIIEKGTPILFTVTGPHYDPKYYKDPTKFIPKRFINEQSANKNSMKMPYLSFGDGPRNCIGMRLGKMQSKIGVCILIRKFVFELGTQHVDKKLKLETTTLVRTPVNGIVLKVKAR